MTETASSAVPIMAEPLLERWTLTCFAFRWNLDVMLVNPAMRLQERKRLFNSKFRYVEHKSSSHINTRPIENSRGQTGHVIEINKDPDLAWNWLAVLSHWTYNARRKRICQSLLQGKSSHEMLRIGPCTELSSGTLQNRAELSRSFCLMRHSGHWCSKPPPIARSQPLEKILASTSLVPR